MHIIQVPRRFVTSHWGGTETVILETSKRLLARGHQSKILCSNALADSNHEIIDQVEINRVPYFYPYIGLKPEAIRQMDHKGGNLFSFALLKALNKEPQMDLLHLHTSKRVGGIGRYIAMKRGIPYVVSLHGGVFDVPIEEAQSMTAPTKGAIEWGKLLGLWVGSRKVFDDASAILCVGAQEQKETQARYPDKNVIFLPNGVDHDRFKAGDGEGFRSKYQISSSSTLLITIGRIDPQKNQRFGINILDVLKKSGSDVHMALIGHVTNDVYFESLKQDIQHLGLENDVTIIPGIPPGSQALVDAYHAADIFFLPSLHEPFGIVILEAWAAGLPVIASRVGGIPSFVENDLDGLLFEPGSLEQGLKAIRALMTNIDKRKKIAEAGQIKATKQYSWDRITNDLIKIYEEVTIIQA